MQQTQLPLWIDPEGDEGGPLSPGEYIRRELQKRGWSQLDLAAVLQRPVPTVNEIIKGKKAVTSEMAVSLGQAFGTSAALWAHREAAYRLSLVSGVDGDTEKKSRLFEIAPIKDLQRRGWINPSAQSADEIEAELTRFMGEDPLANGGSTLAALAKQTFPAAEFSAAQRAWLLQAAHVARQLNARAYQPELLLAALPKLKKFSTKPQHAAKIPITLAEAGVRLVVIEDLPRTRIDGAAFFLDRNPKLPVIALSLRLDRVDTFWQTLGHELRHILNNDPLSLDTNMVGEEREVQVSAMELRADAEAANWLIPEKDIESFRLRAKPWYSEEAVHLFASRMGVHPSIVVGQLQHLGALGWDRHASLRAKIREHVLAVATCDGYGKRL